MNDLSDESDRSEQKGFANLLVGLFGAFRNPTAHVPRLRRAVTDDDLLDLMSMLSLVHRRIDHARLNPRA